MFLPTQYVLTSQSLTYKNLCLYKRERGGEYENPYKEFPEQTV